MAYKGCSYYVDLYAGKDGRLDFVSDDDNQSLSVFSKPLIPRSANKKNRFYTYKIVT